jgi:hypothetical protein
MAPKAVTSKDLGPALGMYSHGMTVAVPARSWWSRDRWARTARASSRAPAT